MDCFFSSSVPHFFLQQSWNQTHDIWTNGKSEIMDGFQCSRCQNDCIDLPNKIGSFASGATTHLVVKSGTKCFKSEIMDRFWCSMCQNDCIKLPNKIGSFASGSTTHMVVKNWTKIFYCSKQLVTKIRLLPRDPTSLHTKFEPDRSMHACAMTFLVHAHYKKEH